MQNMGKWRGDRAEQARLEKGISPTVAAASVGVTAETIRRWEKNEGVPDAEALAALANLLGLTLTYLLDLSDESAAV